MINPQWLKLPMPRTNFHGPKDVRAIEVRLYLAGLILLVSIRMRKLIKMILAVQELWLVSLTDHGRTDLQVDYRAHSESQPHGRSVDFSVGRAITLLTYIPVQVTLVLGTIVLFHDKLS